MPRQSVEPRRASESPISRPQCRICGKTFLRSFHLTRHLKIHEKSESHVCGVCGKVFRRSDVLRRHMLCHSASERSVGRDKRFRACQSCVVAKARCSGSIPCDRCRAKETECRIFPPRNEFSSTGEGDDTASRSQDDRAGSSDSPKPSHNDSEGLSNNDTRMTCASRGAVPITENVMAPTFPRAPVLEQPTTQISNFTQQEDYFPYLRTDYDGPQFAQHPRPGIQLANFTRDGQVVSNHTIVEDQAFNVPTGFDDPESYSSFDLMSMNWLPPNLDSDAVTSIFDGFGFPMPTTGQNISMLPDETAIQSIEMQGGPDSQPAAMNASLSFENHNLDEGEVESAATPALASHRTASSCSITDGKLYIDGRGSRAVNRSHVGRHKRKVQVESENEPTKDAHDGLALELGFPDPLTLPQNPMDDTSESLLNIRTYTELRHNFETLCTSPSSLFTPFSSGFPSFDDFDFFIRQYLKSVQPTLPFIHKHALLHLQQNWVLILAIATTGCSVTDMTSGSMCLRAFQEFLRRAIVYEIASRQLKDPLGFAQATLLTCISVSQCQRAGGWREEREEALSWVKLCLSISVDYTTQHQDAIQINNSDDWNTWISTESQRRLAYSCWLFARLLYYQFDLSLTTDCQLGNCILPFHDAVWNADNEQSWKAENRKFGVPPSYDEAVKELYLRKRMTESLGNCSQVVLVHAVLERTSNMERFLQDPLSKWIPTKNVLDVPSPKVDDWLPGDPRYSLWRNSACDCFDVLHWQANSLAARANGFEPSVILHLHLARLVMLTPFREIRQFCEMLTRDDLSPVSFVGHSNNPPRKVWQWLVQDQYKARLALIHAGAAIWHVRGWSQKGFLESLTIYLASLIIWTYSTYTAELNSRLQRKANNKNGSHDRLTSDIETLRSQLQEKSSMPSNYRAEHLASPSEQSYNSHSEDHESDDSSSCESASSMVEVFYIDRPCDDHLVQSFVKDSKKKAVSMTRVGPICDRAAAIKVLRQGAKVLAERCWLWPVSRQYRETLKVLGERLHGSMTIRGGAGGK